MYWRLSFCLSILAFSACDSLPPLPSESGERVATAAEFQGLTLAAGRGEVGAAPPARDPLNRVGRKGNEHLVECSGRGSCNEGRCSCFAGYTGHNCDRWVPNKY